MRGAEVTQAAELLARFMAGESLAELTGGNGLDHRRLLSLIAREAADPEVASEALARGEEIRRQATPDRRKPGEPRSGYTRAELLACLREARNHVEGPLTITEFDRIARARTFPDGHPWPHPTTISRRFGSWRRALRAAGP